MGCWFFSLCLSCLSLKGKIKKRILSALHTAVWCLPQPSPHSQGPHEVCPRRAVADLCIPCFAAGRPGARPLGTRQCLGVAQEVRVSVRACGPGHAPSVGLPHDEGLCFSSSRSTRETSGLRLRPKPPPEKFQRRPQTLWAHGSGHPAHGGRGDGDTGWARDRMRST